MITKNYIKMCEKAEEIQKAWKPKQFDSYGSEEYKKAFILDELGMINHIEKYKSSYKWLPTQEQLQEMIEYKTKNGETYLDCFYFWASKKYNCFVFGRDKITWNELWLAFVMKEKWNKEWTGSKWVKAE